jgi:hypothetical protein
MKIWFFILFLCAVSISSDIQAKVLKTPSLNAITLRECSQTYKRLL